MFSVVRGLVSKRLLPAKHAVNKSEFYIITYSCSSIIIVFFAYAILGGMCEHCSDAMISIGLIGGL